MTESHKAKVVSSTTKNEPTAISLKTKLILMIALSSGLDLLTHTIELPFIIATFGGALILDEIVEYFLSKLLASFDDRIELSKSDIMFGMIPIPGITALSIRCVKLLLKAK